jgi:hypothetical protein
MKSRFFSDDMLKFGVQDIEISKVFRIHNKFLRNKFEEKIESLVDIQNFNYKKSLEFLFFGNDP